VACDQYPKSLHLLNEAMCVLTSFISDLSEKGVRSIGDETEVVEIGAEPVVDVSMTNNDGNLFVLALVSCHHQNPPTKKPIKH